MAYPFFSLAKSKRLTPIDFRAGSITIRVEAVCVYGMATIWDADVLIWAASQIVHARDAGLRTFRLMAASRTRSSPSSGAAPARTITSDSRPASTDSSRPRSQPRSGSWRNVAASASPASMSGRKRPTPTGGRWGSN